MEDSDSEELLYVQGSKVWIPNDTIVWQSVTLTENYKKGDTALHTINESGKTFIIKLRNEIDLPPLCNPAVLIGQNNLVALSYLHEPAVLYNLKVRFKKRQCIYTYCGIVLVAINPYADLPFYGHDIIRAYRGHSIGELEPHIYAVAEEAYTKLEREKCNLSIIVSGESGAGKTVSAKYAMRYFATVGGSESETKIEKKVLASSPIMESIGNATTCRNDNSSRFGKFTKLLFKNKNELMALTGATMQTYLLEKSRVVFQSLNERNYHIFYQLCSSIRKDPELLLDNYKSFKYINMGGLSEIKGIPDSEKFDETWEAFIILGFTVQEVRDIMKVLAAILHLGNIKFNNKSGVNSETSEHDECDILPNDMHLNILDNLLKINSTELRKWLITRQIKSINENVLIPNSIFTAEATKDALAKHIYAKLFHYIVLMINKSLNSSENENCFIGVLDIYGFETFQINSFEQFCINYANEKLQQQFNQHVFKLEQEEYLKEGIVWTLIDFHDNQPCIDLIESKLGILDLLDEECKIPKGSDESWAEKVIEKCGKFHHFKKPRFGKMSFLIKHFSDTVDYDVKGFLEKNRDTVSKELINVIENSGLSLCRKLMEDQNTSLNKIEPKSKSFTKQNKQTVGSQFRESLTSLIKTLHLTTPHYVRCIKPNDSRTPFEWEAPKIVQQLRACGVLETVRISAAGFPSRWTYLDFYERYRLLYSTTEENIKIKLFCEQIIGKWLKDEEKYKLGHTKIFFRAGQVAYLEQVRSNIRKQYIIVVQSTVRRFIERRSYKRLLNTAIGLQKYSRGLLCRRRIRNLRENLAAIYIQKFIRGWIAKKKYITIRFAAIGIQQYARGNLARKRFEFMVNTYKVTQIQRFCRGYLARIKYKQALNKTIKCQAFIRAFLARRFYKKLKAEARTISHIQKRYKGLENKIISMQQKIDDLNRENTVVKTKNLEMNDIKNQLKDKKKLQQNLQSLQKILVEKETSLSHINKQLEIERDDKMVLLEEKDKDLQEWEKQKQSWRIENEELKQQLNEMIERAKLDQKTIATASIRFSEVDFDEIRQAYQKSIKDKEVLEQDNNLLRDQIELFKFSKTRAIEDINIANDFGYESAFNTLKTHSTMRSQDFNEVQEVFQTSLIIRLRKILTEEKSRAEYLNQKIERLLNRSTSNISTEESLRASDLEVENNKLRNNYELLRNSIKRGVETQEINAQHAALEEELRRRREECIQLKAVLAQPSQIKLTEYMSKSDNRAEINSDLVNAYQAQKLINRQLESELTALNEENNAKLAQLTMEIENLRTENDNLNHILYDTLDRNDQSAMTMSEIFLKHEIKKLTEAYVTLQEQLNVETKKCDEITTSNTQLQSQLREHGILDDQADNYQSSMAIKRISMKYQGIFKYKHSDLDKILQKLIVDLTPRIAISLLPGLPAYIIFMCIRYTDHVNTDQNVRDLLTKFVVQMKKAYRLPNSPENRIVWLINLLTINNLLKQYGGIEEYMETNTDLQNQQQLKNFDLSEYRKVIFELVVNMYSKLVQQIQEVLKPLIVPAILDHDEISRSKNWKKSGKTLSLDTSPELHKKTLEPKTLIHQLDYYYKHLQFFGLDNCFIEQLLKQFIYYICAISMNSLMLSGKRCMWKTGMNIRYNISCLEDWARKKKILPEIFAPMAPLNQVSALLQSRKSEKDVQSICDLCSSLSVAQVLKIIKSYNHHDDSEILITSAFVDKLTKKLNERQKSTSENDKFTMDEGLIFPPVVKYKNSDTKLEDIELPKILELDDLLIKI